MTWDATHLVGKVNTRDIVETAKAYVPKMKEEGADIIVALSHSGISADATEPGAENASLQLAAVDGIDVVFTGHQHLVFPNSKDYEGVAGADITAGTLSGKPAVMAGFWGSHMGLIDLMLEKNADGKWAIVSHTSEARPIFERVEGKVHAARRVTKPKSPPPSPRTIRRRSNTSAARSARPPRRSTPTSRSSPTIPRCRS